MISRQKQFIELFVKDSNMQKQYFQSDFLSQPNFCFIIDISRASSAPGAVSEEPVNRVMMKWESKEGSIRIPHSSVRDLMRN